MARISKSGRLIISAAEVGSFVVCQEAWRLREIEKAKTNRSESAIEGGRLHQVWADQFDQALFLSNAVKIILFLILIAIFFHLAFGIKT